MLGTKEFSASLARLSDLAKQMDDATAEALTTLRSNSISDNLLCLVDQAFHDEGERFFSEGYRWLREAIAGRNFNEIKEILTDANFHNIVERLDRMVAIYEQITDA